MKDAKTSIDEAIQVLDDNTADYEALLRASGTAMGLLGNALAALESEGDEEVLAEWKADVDPIELRRLIWGIQEEPWVVRALSFVSDRWTTDPRFGPAMSKELAENSRFKQRATIRIVRGE